jgi:hypothetical protein
LKYGLGFSCQEYLNRKVLHLLLGEDPHRILVSVQTDIGYSGIEVVVWAKKSFRSSQFSGMLRGVRTMS